MSSIFSDRDGITLEEALIALLVLGFFGWLCFKFGLFDWAPAAAPALAGDVVAVQDSDGDGVTDTVDGCPNVAGALGNRGCPGGAADRDNDGTPDEFDRCPVVAGSKVERGCPAERVAAEPAPEPVAEPEPVVAEVVPDSDGDGVNDADDLCPDVAGTENGCPPDTDGDGIIDAQDSCPELAGDAATLGCPADTDKDGVYDTDDRCPEVAGATDNEGCPADSDGDGFSDTIDACPDRAGPPDSDGCPAVEVSEETQKLIEEAVSNVAFQTDKAVLTEYSQDLLQKVATLLADNPDYKIKMTGHTDWLGEDAHNLQLSKDRAKACFEFLLTQGVDAARMSYDGKGETEPVADNNSRSGRLKNRRVEFELHY